MFGEVATTPQWCVPTNRHNQKLDPVAPHVQVGSSWARLANTSGKIPNWNWLENPTEWSWSESARLWSHESTNIGGRWILDVPNKKVTEPFKPRCPPWVRKRYFWHFTLGPRAWTSHIRMIIWHHLTTYGRLLFTVHLFTIFYLWKKKSSVQQEFLGSNWKNNMEL